mgnify:CR=1 FL=1
MTDTAKPMITLQQIRDAGPCESGWRKLKKALGNPDMARKISIGDVVLSNGLVDALWCLRCLPARERVAAVMPSVRRASAHTSDQRVHKCIAAIDRWLAGDDNVDLQAARAGAARAGAAEAARAAEAAAEAARAAEAAAGAAWAAWAATAAEEAVRAAVRAAGWKAEREQQRRDLLDMFPPMVLTEGEVK